MALVTGASSGIGRDTAIDLARRGARVAICARRKERLEDTLADCREHEPTCQAYVCDVADTAQVRSTVDRTVAELGPIDLLVNNAGIGAYHLFAEAPEGKFESIMRTNCFSAVEFTRAVVGSMLERRTGAIVFVSSFAGRIAPWRHTAYSASKFAVTGLAEALYYEVKPSGVHVALIHPGVIATELFENGEGFEHLRHIVEPQMRGTEIVTRAIARAIERERFEIFVPGRFLWIWKLRVLFPRAVMAGTLAFVRKQFLGRTSGTSRESPG